MRCGQFKAEKMVAARNVLTGFYSARLLLCSLFVESSGLGR